MIQISVLSAVVMLVVAAAAMVGVYRLYVRRIHDERRHAQRMAELNLAVIEALARAIDAKDQTTPNHIRRVQAYSAGLARVLGMSPDEVEGITTAALLHDIGKLAIPEHILAKPGPLTPEEFQKVRVHPQVGAEILRSVPFPQPVASIVLSHHERWDGRGYPAGLREDEIPLGARVIGIVGYFDALTSDRPYHKAISQEAAAALLQQEAGKALDPRLVEAFVNALPMLNTTIEPVEAVSSPALHPTENGDALRVPGGPSSGEPRPTVFDDIAVAHREIYALYQIAESMGTSLGVDQTMALTASKLSSLIPFSACALFLYSDSTEELQCRFATGTDSELLQQLTLRSGQGLNGWVARNQRPLVNASPVADLQAMGSNAPTLLHSALVCPLLAGGQLIGTLAVYHVEPSFYREDHRRLLERVCEQAAAVVHNALVFERTQEDSLTDALTGLPNTRSLFHHLAREFSRAERLNSEVAIVLMDLDGFKDINDTHGHQAGDAALREVASALRNGIRPYDMCVRYAGDEFIVVLAGCGRGEAENKRRELQALVAAIEVETGSTARGSLSISAGVAVFPHDGRSHEALLAKADSRMYNDKSERKAAVRV
jgi:diguanylate cyclase (GGDEF)-like protein/putative nucleotidyltransferase with HDIG domain